MQQALDALERGDKLRALRLASVELRSPSPSPDAMRVITDILGEARAGAERARGLAERASGAVETAEFKDAARLESMARSEWDDGRFESAFRWFTAARAKFARVAQPGSEGPGQAE
jgi:hypothetical protein